MTILWLALVGVVVSVVVFDLTQRRHAILRNFPIIGHFRYLFESVGPELRQYIVTNNNEERPFNRQQRRWVYASSKLQNNYFGFGSDNELEASPNYHIIKHAAFPLRSPHKGEPDFDPDYRVACTKVLGGPRRRVKAFRAAPLVFADHVGLPFKIGFSRVQHAFAEYGMHDKVVWIGSGKLGFPDAALLAFALGCDLVNVAREALLSIGCIQALKCHTNCPTGVTTQSAWLSRGLDPESKAVRMANYVVTLRKELLALCRACGVSHPALVTADQIEILDARFGTKTVAELLGGRGRGLAAGEDRHRRVA